MKNKILISALFLFCLPVLQAQQIGIYSHEFYKPMISNPAFTGNSGLTNAMLISRSQWINFRNAPQLNIFTLDGMIPNKKMGLGIDLFSDRKGISNKTGGNIYYSYMLTLNENTKFTFGIALGIMDHTLHYSEAVLEDPSDPSITGAAQRVVSINANAGIGFTWKKLQAGISLPQLLGNSLEYQDNTTGRSYYALARHYEGSLKYQLMLSEAKQISLTPLAIVHFLPGLPVQYDAHLNLEWKDKFWIGATYKNAYAVSANAGFCISKQFYIGYSYDFSVGSIGKYSGMSHELMVNFVFGRSKHENEKAPETVSASSSSDKEKTDSLQTELEIKDNKIKADEERIRQMNSELTKLRSDNESLQKTPGKTNDPVVNDPGSKTNVTAHADEPENSARVMPAKTNDFIYLNGKSVSGGFYVITGAYINKEFALAEIKKLRSAGHRSAKILYSPAKQFNYIAVSAYSNKEKALKEVVKMKSEGINEVWILSIEK